MAHEISRIIGGEVFSRAEMWLSFKVASHSPDGDGASKEGMGVENSEKTVSVLYIRGIKDFDDCTCLLVGQPAAQPQWKEWNAAPALDVVVFAAADPWLPVMGNRGYTISFAAPSFDYRCVII